jgi:dipeptidyl aminopeptidase/acylaminoacyl peptidase
MPMSADMVPRSFAVFAVAALICQLTGCAKNESTPVDAAPDYSKPESIVFPELGPVQRVQLDMQLREATIERGGISMKVWFYQPLKSTGKLPLVLVPPAGSTLIAGMRLGNGDRAEHVPYVKAGFAVAAFEIDGAVADGANDTAIIKGATEFRQARAGLANAKVALDFILAKAPNIDPNRVYIAGHSSAGTLALLVAAHDPRIKACAAYAPCTDVEKRLAQLTPMLDSSIPGYRDFLHFSSPKNHVDTLTCPVFLFHAIDDNNVRIGETTEFATNLKKTNSQVVQVTAAHGGHYDSMVHDGMPKGIAWLLKLGKEGGK